jgi:hypothetical protein
MLRCLTEAVIVKAYQNKQDLIDAVNKTYDAFVAEFAAVDEQDIHVRIDVVDKTPAEMLAYQIGWLNLLMDWEKNELAGREVVLPAPGIKWNQIGTLQQKFYADHQKLTLAELLNKFAKTKNKFTAWIDSLEDKTLFGQNQRKWASSTPSKWPVWKWLHINSVAPFSSFRAKIRKWKRE